MLLSIVLLCLGVAGDGVAEGRGGVRGGAAAVRLAVASGVAFAVVRRSLARFELTCKTRNGDHQ